MPLRPEDFKPERTIGSASSILHEQHLPGFSSQEIKEAEDWFFLDLSDPEDRDLWERTKPLQPELSERSSS